MSANTLKVLKSVLTAACAASLVLTAGISHAAVTLTAKPTTTTLPDGKVVPMWGLFCGPASGPNGGTCTTQTGVGQNGATWQPPLIRVQTGAQLDIVLTNKLKVPTSLTIVGQVGGGLGAAPTRTFSPVHATQTTTTWPIAASAVAPFTPPAQAARVQSFATEVAAGATSTTLSWVGLRPGTYLLESGTHPSIQGPMGLYGVVVVADTAVSPKIAYPGVAYDVDAPVLLSEIDPLQNAAVDAAVNNAGFSETAVWSGAPGACGDVTKPITAHTCYPPAVNYSPVYYLINGVAFDRTHPTSALIPLLGHGQVNIADPGALNPGTITSAIRSGVEAVTGNILLRFVNAGLRMHVPSVVGLDMDLMAEDGNLQPDVALQVAKGLPLHTKVQSEVFLAAGKTYDVVVTPPSAGGFYNPQAFPIFDRELSLSNNNQRDGGMQAYLQVGGGDVPFSAVTAVANADKYFLVSGNTIGIAEPGSGVMANDVGVYGVSLLKGPTGGTLTLNADGTFTYVPNTGTTSDSFTYCANGTVTTSAAGSTCSSNVTATVTLAACTGTCLGAAPTAAADAYTSNIASRLQINPPGVLGNDADPSGLPLSAALVGTASGGTVTLNADGSFVATPAVTPTAGTTATVTFQYNAVNSQHTSSGAPATVTVTFNGASGIQIAVKDAPTGLPITDYRWIIEEDRSMYIDPACQVNSATRPAGCPPLPVPSLGVNFHTSFMPVVAQGCVGTIACESGQTVIDPATGLHVPAVCDVGNGVCVPGTQQVAVDPSQVALDPTKRYYISVLPGDAGNPFKAGAGAPVQVDPACDPTVSICAMRQFSIAQDCGPYAPTNAAWTPGGLTALCGHGMGGAPITPAQIPSPTNLTAAAVSVPVQQTPFPTAKISVYVFEDDSPLNGEDDAVGLVDSPTAKEPGLGGFQIYLYDSAGATGDSTGQMTYDMFNMPLSNSLAHTIDPVSGLDACPISATSTDGLVGMIVTCPKYEADGKTLSPLVGQAVIANMMPGRYGVEAQPSAERYARGEEWVQTNTLDGQKAHDVFVKVGGPMYFQEFGPSNFHVVIGFANPAIINARRPNVCASTGLNCSNSITGRITDMRVSRTPDQRLYSSGSHDALAFTQCYISLGDPIADDIAFAKCAPDGTFSFSGIPDGNWRMTLFDQWNDQIVDGLATPVTVKGGMALNMGDIPVQQWHTNLYTRTFFDLNGDGVSQASEPGLALVPTNVRFRDGSFSNYNSTDLNGYAGFNEIFPLFNWYVLESDTTRYKQTGVHVVYDAGGPADGTPGGGNSSIAQFLANTAETIPIPPNLRVPGAVYCSNADCNGFSIANGPASSATGSTGRIDPPWVTTEAWQGFIGNAEFVEFGKVPFAVGENGGIRGEVAYASTRAFDDPGLTVHTSWMPNVAGVTVNLYQEVTAPDGTTGLKLIDTTKSSSWDDWAQGFRTNGMPNMNCPGQDPTSPFFFTLQNSTQWLNPNVVLPYNSQFKCYDGLAAYNHVQPAPYDGMYEFPSVTARDAITGKPMATNCTACIKNPADGNPMLPVGKYVVEIVVPPGYELMKEEDKNILIGDNYIAPVTQQFGGLSNIFILPDQASLNANYNPNNAQNPSANLGTLRLPRHEGDTGMIESFWPCVGTKRTVPDYLSIFPGVQEVAPFAGATRPLCDRKEVTLTDQSSSVARFYIFSSAHIASHYAGIITDDLASEFDPFSPQFGEKFAVPNLPISFKDFTGTEISRAYSDQWGYYNGLTFSSWEVNPPNPTGYAPQMMVTCMNDPGPILDTRTTIINSAGQTIPNPTLGQMITDPLYNPNYSQFCYELPFMPGRTAYLDTPVVPTAAFAEGYNPVDCAYPDLTPAIKSVSGSGIGPWVPAAGGTLTITALGDQLVPNDAYTGPQATTAPYNQRFIPRHYGFGAGQGSVTIGGVPATVNSWSDLQITVTVPAIPAAQSTCPIQQIGQPAAQCGELVITAANGQQSIDAVTVTIGGKAPTYVNGENATNNALQTAIDNALPGDLIMVGPGTYSEMLIMWKPVRLQGVGAASVTLNANTHPSGKLDPWRRQLACLFGVAMNGGFISAANPYDSTGTYACPVTMQGQVDPLPEESIIGWGPLALNGNPGEILQEANLMGAYEGAGITVLGKGWSAATTNNEGAFIPTTLLTNSTTDCTNFPSNFLCNPSSVDGITLTNSSQGGGAILLHAWNHNMNISNNRIYANAGTMSGGISVGQIENPQLTAVNGVQPPFGFNQNVHIHHNYISSNASYGDEMFASMNAAGGAATFCTGSDYYKFDYNWVCGNLSTGGGGVDHSGFSYNGTIAHNWILFNQSNNPTLPTNGGGISVMGQGEAGELVGAGPGLVIDANLIMGNTAESGSGGGIRLEGINGGDVTLNPTDPTKWYDVTITNNIIANNVAGWDGGGVSMQDALKVNFINNTVVSNDSTASSGALFAIIGEVNTGNPSVTTSPLQPAGFVTMRNTPNLIASLPATVNCPAGFYPTTVNGECRQVSLPLMLNNLFWQNRAFNIQVGGLGTGLFNQQNLVGLVPALNQTATGACPTGANYWDIGIRGDLSATPNSGSGFMLNPTNSVLTNAAGYDPSNLQPAASGLVSQYCNGARVPPEICAGNTICLYALGYNAPPGIADARAPNPLFSLTPAATVDEGNNWINMAYGPLSLTNPALPPGSVGYGVFLGDYSILPDTAAFNAGAGAGAPNHDFFGNPRPALGEVDIGAVELQTTVGVAPNAVAFGTQPVGVGP